MSAALFYLVYDGDDDEEYAVLPNQPIHSNPPKIYSNFPKKVLAFQYVCVYYALVFNTQHTRNTQAIGETQ